MTFGEALEYVKRGFKAYRKGWNGKDQYIEIGRNISYVNSDNEIIDAHHRDALSSAIVFVGTRGSQVGWLASQADMLALDWELKE